MKFNQINHSHICKKYFFAFLLIISSKQNSLSEFIFGVSSGYAIESYSKYHSAPLGHYIYKKDNNFYFSSVLPDQAPQSGDKKTSSKVLSILSPQLPLSEEYTSIFALDNHNRAIFSDIFSSLKFTTLINSIPFDFNIQYEFAKKFRLGLGIILIIRNSLSKCVLHLRIKLGLNPKAYSAYISLTTHPS